MKTFCELFWTVESQFRHGLLCPSQDHPVYSVPARGVSGETGEFTQLPDYGVWHHRPGHGQRIPAGWGDRGCRGDAAVPQVRGPAWDSLRVRDIFQSLSCCAGRAPLFWSAPSDLSPSFSHTHTRTRTSVCVRYPVSVSLYQLVKKTERSVIVAF